jgi:hypothetical protein
MIQLNRQAKIINFTGHLVNIIDENGLVKTTYPPSGRIARIDNRNLELFKLNGTPVLSMMLKDITDLPRRKKDTFFIVSRIIALACPNRKDLIVPNDIVRDGRGEIYGCRSFARV